MKFFLISCSVVIVGLFVLAAQPLLHGDTLVHTDIARDFLILEEMRTTRKPPLIGPKTGGIDGVFHGPWWYYGNLPAFVLVQGNPVGMGWFWLVLAAGFVGMVGIFGWQLTRDEVVVGAISILAAALILPPAQGFFNPSGAVLLAPLFFVVFFRCLHKPSLWLALASWFLIGCFIQFEMAFGGPILLLALPIFGYRVWQRRAFRLLLTPLILVVPLATFVVFDLRHDFLQARAVLRFLTERSGGGTAWLVVLQARVRAMLLTGWNPFMLVSSIGAAIVAFTVWRGTRSQDRPTQRFTTLFLYLYSGFWVLTLGFPGEIWAYYTAPFAAMVLLVLAVSAARDRFAKALVILAVVVNLWPTVQSLRYRDERYNSSSWAVLSRIARESYQRTPELGYFLYSQDQYAYQLKYAFQFWARRMPGVKAVAYEKQPTTVLVMGSDDPRNPFSSAVDWRKQKIAIDQPPLADFSYPFGYRVEVYVLTPEQQAVAPDPNLIKGLEFR